jgi:hypothetical protein
MTVMPNAALKAPANTARNFGQFADVLSLLMFREVI